MRHIIDTLISDRQTDTRTELHTPTHTSPRHRNYTSELIRKFTNCWMDLVFSVFSVFSKCIILILVTNGRYCTEYWRFSVRCPLGHDLPWMLFRLYSFAFKRFHWLKNPTQRKQRALCCVDDNWGGLLGHRGICVIQETLPCTRLQVGVSLWVSSVHDNMDTGTLKRNRTVLQTPKEGEGHTALMFLFLQSLLQFLLLSLKKTIQKWNTRHCYITDSYEGPCYQPVTMTVIVCAVRNWIALSEPMSRFQTNDEHVEAVTCTLPSQTACICFIPLN